MEEWKDGVRAGRKLDVYGQVKTDWGFGPYLEGRYGEWVGLMVKFRSGSALLGEEIERWGRGKGEDVVEEGGYRGIVPSVQ